MKKLLALLLTVVIIFSFTACGFDLPFADGNSKKSAKDEGGKMDLDVVAIDNSECTVKITGIEFDNKQGYTLKVYLENKSSDKKYMFAVDSASLNGIQCSTSFACSVAAGKKSNNKITFATSTIEESGLNPADYTDIELTFRVYDYNNWFADDVAYETVNIYPHGKDKATKYTLPAQQGKVLVDNQYARVVAVGYHSSKTSGYAILVYFENKTDKTLMFSIDDASVNDYMADPFFAHSVKSQKCSFAKVTWSSSNLESIGVTDVKSVEFKLRAYDYNDWMADDLINVVIKLNS